MAFDINGNGGYGTGSDGNLTATAAQIINTYASVSAISGANVTLGNTSGAFTAGKEILIHVSGYKGTADTCAARGAWAVATISSINSSNGNLVLDRDVSSILGGLNISQLYVQVVSLPNYKTVTLNSGKSITCPQFTATNGYGGLVAFKCSVELKFNGGHIDLTGKGLEATTLFDKGLVDKEPHDTILRESAGWENHRAQNHLTINYPDGACFLIAKLMTCHDDSRIGNTTSNLNGLARSTWKTGSPTGNYYHSHWGGASILIAAETVADFNAAMIAKYAIYSSTTPTRGYGRCYIATKTVLPNDEGLYAYDCIADPERLTSSFNIKNFGDGSFGDKTNYKTQLNNYAAVIGLDTTRKVITINKKTTEGLAKFETGAMVMIHLTQKDNLPYAGRFILAKILGVGTNTITIDTAVPSYFWYTKYYMQLVTIPQFTTFTLSAENTGTPKFAEGRGGICAVAVSGTCNLNGGKLNVEGKGGAPAYGEKGLNYISNAQMSEKLPIGEGNGSVFILANNLTMNSSTRLGATWTGNYRGGIIKNPASPSTLNYAYNYPNQRFEGGDLDYVDKGYNSSKPKETESENVTLSTGATVKTFYGAAGGGKRAGGEGFTHAGGFGSNASDGAYQGAHVLIVANKITGLNVAALSTGGQVGTTFHGDTTNPSATAGSNGNGGCGYGGAGGAFNNNTTNLNRAFMGGGGGYLGGGQGISYSNDYVSGGGSGAFAFVYANQLVDADYSGIVYD